MHANSSRKNRWHVVSSPAVLAVLVALTVAGATPASADTPFLGEIKCFSFNFAPKGWALTNGQLMAINVNTALFSLLGTTYGGDGITNFRLPNIQHRIMIGGASGSHVLGEAGGSDSKTILLPNLPAHVHQFAPLGSNAVASSTSPAGNVPAVKPRTALYIVPGPATGNVAMAGATSGATGAGSPAPLPNLQPYLTFTCAIALQGIFPSRE
jgi:microcystin-dependent protein